MACIKGVNRSASVALAEEAECCDVFGLDEELLEVVPKPVLGVLLLSVLHFDAFHLSFCIWFPSQYRGSYFCPPPSSAKIGPIPTDDGVGKEVITRMTANMATNKEFYTDSNGRDFLKRVRDHRDDWPLQVTQPVAGNYYPLNLGIYTKDKKSEFSVLVDRATGGASIKDGEVELMLHRRILHDDGRGVGEALDEQVCVNNNKTCEGLTVRGNYYISIDKLGAGARWRRTTGQEIYSPFLLAFTHENSESWKSSHWTKGTIMDPNYSLPPNVALITLEELDGGVVLLRLAHLYEASEDAEYSTLTKVELKKLFAKKTNVECSARAIIDLGAHTDSCIIT
ncbi:alpha-mannosidase [Vigna unguiculata]|uniref:Alpha-mannosidase n=1 Tax=Vigna unguiculata TaxID=3917 RepID=A0A4D6NI65_VIGUN|nr:alpha-mannosidase [Vigna unguiculata]